MSGMETPLRPSATASTQPFHAGGRPCPSSCVAACGAVRALRAILKETAPRTGKSVSERLHAVRGVSHPIHRTPPHGAIHCSTYLKPSQEFPQQHGSDQPARLNKSTNKSTSFSKHKRVGFAPTQIHPRPLHANHMHTESRASARSNSRLRHLSHAEELLPQQWSPVKSYEGQE